MLGLRKKGVKSLLVGGVVEAVLAGCFALGGFGPCGPSNLFGFIGFISHIFPGFLLAIFLSSEFGLPDKDAVWILIGAQMAFWWLLAYLVWERRR
jgi:hypothetical protein